MILMVSVQNVGEALQALKGGADIVDVKNLQEALVGSAEPQIVADVLESIPTERHGSVTLGVVPNQAGTVAMSVYTARILDATSVKVGFMNSTYDEALDVLLACKRALVGSETKLIGSLFADNGELGALDVSHLIKLCEESKCDGFLIDTLSKDGRNLFDFISESQLHELVIAGKEARMSTALSGHLKISDLDELARINPDIVGVRGAVCTKGNRSEAVYWEAVADFKSELFKREQGEINVHQGEHNINDLNTNGQDLDTKGIESGWVVIDGTGKTCAGVIAMLSEQVKSDTDSVIEIIMSDVLSSYDVSLWARRNGHIVLSQRRESPEKLRMLVRP